jgi:hypothetical protein
VSLDGLDELTLHAEHRVQGRQRVLEDGGDVAPAQRPLPGGRQVVDATATVADLAARDGERRVEEPGDGRADHRLSGPGFPHEPEDLARHDGEGDAAHEVDPAAVAGQRHREVAHLEKGLCLGASARGILRRGGGAHVPVRSRVLLIK